MGRKQRKFRVIACAEALEARRLLTRLAVVGDFSPVPNFDPTNDVANLIKSWNVEAVLTVGDNNYDSGSASTIDQNIGQFYQEFIYPYFGTYGSGSPTLTNRFWPALGNHDWDTPGATPYLNYFTLPNNERYYKVSIGGDIDVFVMDSDPREPDGTTWNSTQAAWIRQQMLASTAKWKLVTMHHSPFTSGNGHGSDPITQWPYKEWGATAVLSGHDHIYERLHENNLPYFVSGLGGRSIHGFNAPITGSAVRYDANYGAMRIDTTPTTITFQFYNRAGTLIDTHTINSATTAPTRQLIPTWSTWKYLDNGSNQGTAWRELGFNDASWSTGSAELGYGDGDEETVVSFGPNSNSKFTTTYFRKTFNVSDPANVTSLLLNVVRDDGAVVYLNGTEVARINMPGGTITSSTPASSNIGDAEESAWVLSGINPSLLVSGTNVLAVEMHQISGTSSDLSFNLDLTAVLANQTTPAAPSGLAAGASGVNINLAWTDNSNNENQFLIERSTDGINFAPIDVTGVDVNSYSDATAASGTTYHYRVRAITTAQQSAPSNVATATSAAVTLIPTGAVWKYLDNGSNQITAWRATAFNDASWAAGPAQLGYGDGDEATVVSYGGNPNNKFITTYFRKGFNIADPANISALTMRIHRDDGAVVYLNGTEVFRTNMPGGTIAFNTLAASAAEETTFYTASINPALLQAGNNVIAVEIHQSAVDSSDISFDFELKATVSDTVPPTAALGSETPSAGGATFDFTVTYADAASGVDTTTFDSSDITVTGPGGFSANATFISAAGTVATYRINAPGGTWNLADNGVYTVSQNANQVRDLANNARPAGAIGTFNVSVPFAWMSGSTLNVEFDGSATPITLGASAANVVATRSAVSLTFSGVISIAALGTASNDALQISGTLPAALSFSNGTGNDSVRVLAGTHTFASDLSPTLLNVAVTIDAGANATFNSDQHLANLVVDGVATLASGGNRVIDTLNVTGTGRLDLRDNMLIRRYTGASPIGSWNGSNYNGITGVIRAGRNGGLWNGNGLVTSMPDAILPSRLATLGISQTPSSVIVKYTFVGDANLDQIINGDDFHAIDSGFPAATGYANGDFDYSGRLDADDYFHIDSNYNKAQTPLTPAPVVESDAAIIADPASELPKPFFAGASESAYRRLLENESGEPPLPV